MQQSIAIFIRCMNVCVFLAYYSKFFYIQYLTVFERRPDLPIEGIESSDCRFSSTSLIFRPDTMWQLRRRRTIHMA